MIFFSGKGALSFLEEDMTLMDSYFRMMKSNQHYIDTNHHVTLYHFMINVLPGDVEENETFIPGALFQLSS